MTEVKSAAAAGIAVVLTCIVAGPLSAQAASPAWSDEVSKVADRLFDVCESLKGDDVAACYKLVAERLVERAKKASAPGATVAKPTTPPPATTDLPSSSPIKLSAADIAVQTHKWDGKVVQIAARCFYADRNEYRCISDTAVRVDFTRLQPDAMRELVERQCDSINKLRGRTCQFQVQFVYSGFDEQSTGGLGNQKFVVAKDFLGHVVGR